MSRNSFDEGDDKIMPLARSFTVTDEGKSSLRAGDFAASRRMNSIRRANSKAEANANTNNSSFYRSKSVKETSMSRKKPTEESLERANTLSNKGFAPSRSKSLRAPPPPRLHAKRDKLGVPTTQHEDFPSPGEAPRGQRIFDAQAVAEDEGVEVAEGGWDTDTRTQQRLEAERKRIEEEERLAGLDGDLRQNKTGRTRSKSFKDILLRR